MREPPQRDPRWHVTLGSTWMAPHPDAAREGVEALNEGTTFMESHGPFLRWDQTGPFARGEPHEQEMTEEQLLKELPTVKGLGKYGVSAGRRGETGPSHLFRGGASPHLRKMGRFQEKPGLHMFKRQAAMERNPFMSKTMPTTTFKKLGKKKKSMRKAEEVPEEEEVAPVDEMEGFLDRDGSYQRNPNPFSWPQPQP